MLDQVGRYKIIYLDDIHLRQRAADDPKLFLDQYDGPIVLDEATLVPELFLELKRRVDEYKRAKRRDEKTPEIDIWITGSNQTLLQRNVQESLAGRTSYFDLNTLSWHELSNVKLKDMLIKGGWPELHANADLSPISYLNDLISTFIEKDIVNAAGIERKAAFTTSTGLLAARIGQILNASDIARNVGVDTTTLISWISKLEQNGLVRLLRPYFSNINQRLIKTPKVYFEDVGLASRFQGWTNFEPLFLSTQYGHLIENLALNEVTRFFQNRGLNPEVFYIRSKEKVEIDILVKLPNDRWLAIEVKTSAADFTEKQVQLLESVNLNVIERWITTPSTDEGVLKYSRIVPFLKIHSELERIHSEKISP